MADRAQELQTELAGLLAEHERTLSADERAHPVRLEEGGYRWRRGSGGLQLASSDGDPLTRRSPSL